MENLDQIQKNTLASIPSWLEVPPSGQVSPPVQGNLSELPFGSIHWEDFEKLCLRLVRLDATVEYCTLYGRTGQKQEGIDIYARKTSSNKYKVYQCKRVDQFTKGDIKKAINEFLEGKWADQSESFFLCTSRNLRDPKLQDTIEQQNKKLKEKGINLIPWDYNELNIKLKDHPKIVDDFFGREWVKAFCGVDQANQFGTRLDAQKIAELRKELGRFYKNVFNTQDPGLLSLSGLDTSILHFEDRYVLHDIYENKEYNISYNTSVSAETRLNNIADSTKTHDVSSAESRGEYNNPESYQVKSSQKNRTSVENWLIRNNRNIILGDPGSGKSSLLRFLAIDLLSEEPQLNEFVHSYGNYLPVLIPFGMWTTLIQRDSSSTHSLQDVLRLWLERWNEQRLWPLVEKSLEDERLLLLVDGLDEWIDQTAGKIALDQLLLFIKQRNTPALLTSRPLGFKKLGMSTSSWQEAELAEFSISQQEKLTQTWFKYWIANINNSANSEDIQSDHEAEKICKEFWTEMSRAASLKELSKIPLLLSLLIFLWLQKSKLPRNRFKAYNEMIDHLIAKHPQRRNVDMGCIENVFCNFSFEDIWSILSNIAYNILLSNPEGVIEITNVKEIVSKHLQDSEIGFDYSVREAKKYSLILTEAFEKHFGILVHKSPNEVGFFHRSFLEYLTAYYISRLSFDQQLEFVKKHFSDGQWSEVILALFQITARASDVDKLIETISENISNPLEELYADQILSEVTFGDFNCSIGLIRSLTEKYFEKIELSSWMPHRELLLKNVLNGLHNSKTRNLVRQKISNWYPDRIPRWQDVFECMDTWPNCKEVTNCLFKGFYNENSYDKVSCAQSLAKVAKSDSSIGDRLAEIAKKDNDPNVRAAALQGLVIGWPNHNDLDYILKNANNSLYPSLKYTAIICKVERGEHTKEDLNDLLNKSSNMEYDWKYDIPYLINKGWPKSKEVKKECLSIIQSGVYPKRNKISEDTATLILLKNYPQDREIAEFFANQIQSGQHPYILSAHLNAWELLSLNFKDNQKLIETIDVWFNNPKTVLLELETSYAALIGRTDIGKKVLISQLDKGFRFWAVKGLLAGWGMDDDEISTNLTRIAFGPNKQAATIAQYLPQIIKDKKKCRKRLVELLEDKDCHRQDFVVSGLIQLGEFEQHPHIIDALFKALSRVSKDEIGYKGIVDGLIIGCPNDKRVRDLAKKALHQRSGAYKAIATAYGNDQEIRNLLIDIVNPLPSQLRRTIANKLGEELENQDFALSLLQLYDLESDPIVKTESSISYHKLLKLSGQDPTTALEQLSTNIMCYGSDYEERRHAAFCGLLILDQLEIMKNKKEIIGDKDRTCSIRLTHYSKNIPLIKQILDNWNKIKNSFGKDFWHSINHYGGESIYAWENICMLAESYPQAKQEAIDFINHAIGSGKIVTSDILAFISRVCPGSELLKKCCLDILIDDPKRNQHIGFVSVFLAAKLLGEHFENNEEILRTLSEQIKDHNIPDSILLALAYGWNQSNEFKSALNIIREQRHGLDYGIHVKLSCLVKSAQDVQIMISDLLKDCEKDTSLIKIFDCRYVSHSIISRLKEDEELKNMLQQKLFKDPTPSEKASYPRLLYLANGYNPELSEWVIKELSNQQKDFPEVGVDLVESKLMPVSHSLLSILI